MAKIQNASLPGMSGFEHFLDYEALALLLVELELLDSRINARVADGMPRFRWAVVHPDPSRNLGDWQCGAIQRCPLLCRQSGINGLVMRTLSFVDPDLNATWAAQDCCCAT
jgi:hypothetical protein